MEMAEDLSAKVTDEERLSVMYTSGTDGLGTNAKGSSQAQVIDIVGAENAIVVEKVSSKGGGNIVSLEQVYNADPDVILFTADSIYDNVASDQAWANLSAIKEGRFYRIPGEPYNWMSNPPSLNMVMGILWLGNLLYPQYYDYDMTETTVKMFKILWDYDMTVAQAETILGI
jgi:iron complex transport system substrate-binding protein